MNLKNFWILAILLILVLPVGAVNDIVNTHNQVNAGKPVAHNMNIKLHANKNYTGKLNATNAKKYKIISKPKNGKLTVDKNGKFTYIAKKNFLGKDTFKYYVNNGIKDSNTATVTITVTNNPPVVNNLNITPHVNRQYNGKLMGKDTNNDTLTYIIVLKPTNGTIKLNRDGNYTYIPNKNFLGVDSFSYKANDGMNDSNTANVTIKVTNNPPVANNMNINTLGNKQYNGKFNVTDIDGDPLRYKCFTLPAHGTVILKNDGNFIYIPNMGFKGTDSFSYKVRDGYAESDIGNVTITVKNNPPVANNMNISTLGNTLYSGKFDVRDIDGDRLRYDCLICPKHGSITINPDGSFVYVPNKGFIGTDSFCYTVGDGIAESKANVTIKVVNNPPVAHDMHKNITFQTFDRGGFTSKLDATDYDGHPLTYTIVSPLTFATVILKNDGNYNYISGVRYTGNDSFKYKVNDGYEDSNIAEVTISATVW